MVVDCRTVLTFDWLRHLTVFESVVFFPPTLVVSAAFQFANTLFSRRSIPENDNTPSRLARGSWRS